MELFDLSGKVAVITGSSRGIGKAIAERMAEHGAKVVISSRKAGPCDEVAAEINAKHAGAAIAVPANISSKDDLQRLVDETRKAFGKVDILVCNAGILRDKTFANTSEADWDAVVKVHLKGTYCCALPVWKYMKDNGGGSMVLTSSTSGLYGNFGQANYGAAKAGIYGMMRVMAIEGRKYNIRVMGLAPGAYTRMTSDLPGRLGKEPDPMSLPENVAPGVLYMVSDLAADHSGKVLGVSSRGVREIKMLQTGGFNPGRPYTAEEVAEHASEVFFPNAEERTAQTA
jgi:NAD(P)-dependent dehydrogenase (short-subunit alcohol dehydrogenase family)